MDYFDPRFSEQELGAISTLGLAHVGDGVYELMVRTRLCAHGLSKVQNLHRATVELVKAPAQARAAEKLLPRLTEEETAVFKRGRNTRTHAAPNRATVSEYHAATGLETLFGWLYLRGEHARLNELFAWIMEDE